MLNYNTLLPNANEIKLLFEQDRLSSKVHTVLEREYKDFEEYRYTRARSFFSRKINFHSSIKSRDMQLLNFYLKNKKLSKTKLTKIDVAIIEYAVGIISRSELEELVLLEPTP